MNKTELDKFQVELGISFDKVIREEAEMIFLDELANDALATKLIFYGGTALRLAYDSPRYSEDIDLLIRQDFNFEEFEKFISRVLAKNKNWKLKDIKNKRNTYFALIVISDVNLKYNFSLKIEIRKPDKIIDLKTELLLVKSPISILSPLLNVPTLEELKNLKISAIMDRNKARDVFDLWYIAKLQRQELVFDYKIPNYSKRQFQNELKVFLPKKYYPLIDQLYEQIITAKNKKNS